MGHKKSRIRSENLKYTVRRAESIIQVMILAGIYYLIWGGFYKECQDFFKFSYKEKIILVCVYALLVFLVFNLCESFKYGYNKLSDVTISQCIAIIIIDIISYFQLCLIANIMLSFLPIILLIFIDIIACFTCVYIYTVIYHHHNMPENIVLIYGDERAFSLKTRMDTRTDQYRIKKILHEDNHMKDIQAEIIKHDAVILNEVSASIRNDILKFCYENNIKTYVAPKISDIIIGGSDAITLFDTPLLSVKGLGLYVEQRIIKRVMDILLCSIVFIPCSVLILAMAVAIKIEDGGPVFYKQKRFTKDQKLFELIKIRSMIVDAEKGGYNPNMRAMDNDPRITKVGKFIRSSRMDELPQIFNIIKGDMSIVGPRPERVENVESYSVETPEFKLRYKVKGGLTGYAQVYGKYNTTPYDKIRLDLMYIENYSLPLDIKLIFMTLPILFRKESTEGFKIEYSQNVELQDIVTKNE